MTVTDINIKRLRDGDEWRVFDEELAATIGYEKTPMARVIIERHLDEVERSQQVKAA